MRPRWTLTDVLVSTTLLLLLSTYAASQILLDRDTALRARCANNLRQIGHALLAYANENHGSYPRTSYDPDHPAPTWGTPYQAHPDLGPNAGANPFAKDDSPAARTRPSPNDVTAPLYLLMRTEEIASPAFTCPAEGISYDQFGGGHHDALDWTNFNGHAGIRDHLSYSYANPYPSRDALHAGYNLNASTLNRDFALLADMNPGGDALLKVNPSAPPDQARQANALNHARDGQNVLYADGHVDFASHPFVGVHRDNIYTFGPSTRSAGTGIAGPPTSPGDSVLLPTAADVGLTEAAVQRLTQPPGAPLSAEQDKHLRAELAGRYARQTPAGRVTLTITEDRISTASDTGRATYTYSLRGTSNHAIQAILATPFTPNTPATFKTRGDTLTIDTDGPLKGTWQRQP